MEAQNHEFEVKPASHQFHVLFMSFCFFGIFFAFNTSQSLQTTLSKTQGYINLGCLYAMFAIFSVFGPKVVSKVEPKIAMIIGAFTYLIVVVSNYFPSPLVQVPCNLLNGVGAAILWTAQGAYISRCALWDSRRSSLSFADTTSQYNGTFFSIFQFTGCIGAFICGLIRQILPHASNNILFTVLTVVVGIAVVAMFFLPDVKSFESQSNKNSSLSVVSMTETLSLLTHSLKLVMMLPLIMYNGMSIAFMIGDIPHDLSEPFFGKMWILYVTALFYGSNALFSYLFGKLAGGKFGRRGTCLLAFITQVLAFVLVIVYRFNKYSKVLDFIVLAAIVVLMAAGDSVWESQPPAILQSFYALDRERNAAMANQKMWQSIGNCTEFIIGIFITGVNRVVIKAIILLSILVVGYICLIILDFRVQKLDMKKGESSLLLSGIATSNLADVKKTVV